MYNMAFLTIIKKTNRTKNSPSSNYKLIVSLLYKKLVKKKEEIEQKTKKSK